MSIGERFPATSGCHAIESGKNNGFLSRDENYATKCSYINIACSSVRQLMSPILTEMETDKRRGAIENP
jgi:hypothetical protein